MRQLTEFKTIRLTTFQKETLIKLRDKYKVNPEWFIREAISEKLSRDWEFLKEKIKAKDTPF